MLARLAHVIVRRRRFVIGFWIVLTLFGGFAAGQVSKRWLTQFSIPGYPAYETNQQTLKVFGTGEQAPLDRGLPQLGRRDEGARHRAARSRRRSARIVARARVVLLDRGLSYVSKDRHTTYATIYPSGIPDFTRIRTSRRRARRSRGDSAGRHGQPDRPRPAAARVLGRRQGPSILTEALIGGLGALVILFFVFGTLPAVLIPIAIAVASILNTFTLVWILTYITDVSIIVQFLIALVGLGVAIDYALLMIFRFRDELREGEDVETALVEMMTHAGRSVIVSGSTVAVGLLSMVILPLPFIRSIGIGGMLIPAVSVLAAITLLPALLAVLGTRINSLRVCRSASSTSGHPEDGPWGRWARFVMRRPVPVAVGRDRDRRRAARFGAAAEPERGAGEGPARERAMRSPAASRSPRRDQRRRDEAVRRARRRRRCRGDRGEAARGARRRRRVGADAVAQGRLRDRPGDPERRRREPKPVRTTISDAKPRSPAPTRPSAASRRRTATSCTPSTATSRTCSAFVILLTYCCSRAPSARSCCR